MKNTQNFAKKHQILQKIPFKKPKQGLVQDYSQRIEGANIYRQKLSRLKLSRLRPHRHRPGWAKGHGLRHYRQQLYGSETGGGGWGGPAKLYTHLLRFAKNFSSCGERGFGLAETGDCEIFDDRGFWSAHLAHLCFKHNTNYVHC